MLSRCTNNVDPAVAAVEDLRHRLECIVEQENNDRDQTRFRSSIGFAPPRIWTADRPFPTEKY